MTDRRVYAEDSVIRKYVSGHSFVDIGGLWGTKREKVTVALSNGASGATMMDIAPLIHQMWSDFHAHAEAKGFKDQYASISANLDDVTVPERHGQFDVVHCAGIIYHAPNPFHTMMRLRAITRQYLFLNSMTVPDRINTDQGSLDMSEGAILSVPALSGQKMKIVKAHFDNLGVRVHNINSPNQYQWMQRPSVPNYGPWWWLWTPETVASMAEIVGFRRIEIFDAWKGRSHYILLEAI